MDKLSIENEQKLDKAIVLIESIVKIGNSALGKFSTNGYETFVFVFINYLERFVNSLQHVNILLKQYNSNPTVENSIGLILRSSLLDFITIAYLSTYFQDAHLEKDHKKIDRKFDGFVSDQIHNTIKYIKLNKEVGVFKEDDYKKAIENICTNFSFVFIDSPINYENPEKNLISRDYASPTEMFKRIHNHKLTKNYSNAYDLYSYYSKYEHFGIMTHFLQRRGVNRDLDTMISSLDCIILGLGLSLTYLTHYPLEAERTQFKEFQKEFSNL